MHNKEDVIRQSNVFTSAKYDYSGYEINFLTLLIREVNRTQQLEPFYKVDIHEFLSRSNLSVNSFSYIKEVVVKLRSKTFCFFDKREGIWIITGIVDRVEIPRNYGEIKCFINSRVWPLLSNLKSEFTLIDIQSIFSMKGKYSKRIYQYLKQFQNTGTFSIEIEDLKTRLGLKDKYSKYSYLKKRVILPSVLEINELTPLVVSFTEEKRGRSVNRLTFHISVNEGRLIEFSDNTEQIKKRLAGYGLAPWFVSNIAKVLTIEDVNRVCYEIDLKNGGKEIKNLSAYTFTAFANKGVPSEGSL